MKKRILLTLLVMALLIACAIFTVQAAEEETCPHCGKPMSEITWTNFNAATMKSTEGHYRLTKAVTRTTVQLKLDGAANDVVLDLNGFLFNTTGTRSFEIPSGKTLTVIDTVGTGEVSGVGAGSGGVYYVNGGTLNLYGGRSYASTASTYGSVVNVAEGGTFNLYSGATLDASSVTTGSGSSGAIYGNGTVQIHGGNIIGGSVGSGGSIFMNAGSLTVSGGVIEGGQAKNYGDDIYVAKDKNIPVLFRGGEVKGEIQADEGNTLTVSGAPKLHHLFVGKTKLTLDKLTDGADIAVMAAYEDEPVTAANADAATYLEKGYIRPVSNFKKFVCGEDNILYVEDVLCPHCNVAMDQIQWAVLDHTVNTNPNGHYYLEGTVTKSAQYNQSATDLVIDLRGQKFASTGNRAFLIGSGKTLTILDTVGGGSVTGKQTGNGGVYNVNGGTLHLYGGNSYAGTSSTKGSVAYVEAAGTLHIYDGATLDASSVTTGSGSCGAVYSNGGAVNVHGGTVIGGSAGSGGSIFMNAGDLTVSGGTITGGAASNMGDEIYAANADSEILFEGGNIAGEVHIGAVKTLTVSGKVVLGDLKLGSTLVTLGQLTDGADITVRVAEGVFTLENTNAGDYAKYFHSSNTDLDVVVEGNTLALRVPVLCPHCGESMANITWTAFNAATAKANSGHYYLTGKVNRTAGQFVQESEDLVIDLRGYEFVCPGNRAFVVGSGLKLTVLDTVGGGCVTGNGTGEGGVYNVSGELNLYAASKAGADATKGCVAYVKAGGKLNVYAGATLDSNGKTGSAIYATGEGTTVTVEGGDIIVPDASNASGDAISCAEYATLKLTAAKPTEAYHASMFGNVYLTSNCTLETEAGATVINRYGRQFWYPTNFQAVSNYTKVTDYRYIKVYNNSAFNATKDLNIDLNGHQMKLTISDGVTVGAMDSTASLEAAGTGKANVVPEGTGKLASSYLRGDLRYVALVEEGLYTFHPMTLDVSSLALRPGSAGIYYKTDIQCNRILAAAIENYGVAVSLNAMPGENFTTDGSTLYTRIDTENFANGQYTSAIVNHIFTETATNNPQRGEMKIYANSYVTVNVDGTSTALILSDTDNGGKTVSDEDFDGIAYSLRDVLTNLDKDANWNKLSAEHQLQLQNFYEKWFGKGTENWAFTHMRVSQVGFGRVDITPDFAVHIAGGSVNDRVSEGVMDPVYVTCIAITDTEDNTVLLFTQDLVGSAKNYTTKTRQEISKATGIPEANIFISSTHTHSAPDTANNDLTGVQEYRAFYFEKAVEAAQTALADRSGTIAFMGSAEAKTENGKDMVFVRRYVQEGGGYEGGNNHVEGAAVVSHIYDANETMQIINFQRPADGKKDILFTNLGVHATFNGATTQVQLSADFPAGVRSQVEAGGEYLSAHFISAGADQNPTSKLEDEQHNLTYMQYGQRIGQIALDCVDELGKVALGAVNVRSETVTADGNIEDILLNKDAGTHDIKLYTAQLVKSYFDARDFAKADQAAKNIGFKGIYDAIGYINRSNMAETRDITVSTLVLGDLAFILAPYEMFGGSAADLLADSPYKNTFIVTCCNGADGYVPIESAYAYGYYESYTSYVAKGTAEVLVETFLELLNASKNG